MSSLWRTQRIRFPQYVPDGLGRDYYIRYTNGGYWEDQFHINKKPDYERNRYNNYHTLFHQAAPVKYFADGHGRETYIINSDGLRREQKSLNSFQLTDFLRNNGTISGRPFGLSKKHYMSLSEKRYNNQLQGLERKLIKRLYTEPMKEKREKLKKLREEEEERVLDPDNYLRTDTNVSHSEAFPLLGGRTVTQSCDYKGGRKKVSLKNESDSDVDTLLRQSGQIQKYELKDGRKRNILISSFNKDGENGDSMDKFKRIFRKNLGCNNSEEINKTGSRVYLQRENLKKSQANFRRNLTKNVVVSDLDINNPSDKQFRISMSQKGNLITGQRYPVGI